MKTKLLVTKRFFLTSLTTLAAVSAQASVESTMYNVQNKLINTFLPAAAIIGLIIAGISFAVGHENAKRHMMYAIFGTVVGFIAPSLIAMLRGLAG